MEQDLIDVNERIEKLLAGENTTTEDELSNNNSSEVIIDEKLVTRL